MALRIIGIAFLVLAVYLATAVPGGLVLNALVGRWWADRVAANVIPVYGAKEGWEALHG